MKQHVQDIDELYLASDVYVNPAKAEGFALTPIEAIATGNFVISSSKGATNQYLSSQFASLVRARKETCRIWPCVGRTLCMFQSTSGKWDACESLHNYPSWYAIDEMALAAAIRSAPEQASQDVLSFSRNFVCAQFSWSATARLVSSELERLVSRVPELTLEASMRRDFKKYDYLLRDVFDVDDLDAFFGA